MLQEARATARASVREAKDAALLRVEEEFDAVAANLETYLGDVGQTVLPPGVVSMTVAAQFVGKLCVLPGKHVDGEIMTYLNPRLVQYKDNDNDLVVEISYNDPSKYPIPQQRPHWLEALKGESHPLPGCKK